MTNEESELFEKYLNLILDEYMSYVSWDEKLELDSKAIRKKTVQSFRKLIETMTFI